MGSFKHVRLGLTLVYAGLLVSISTLLIIPICLLTGFTPMLLAVIPLSLSASLLSMIGRILCLSVPEQVKASGIILAAVSFDILSLIATVSSIVPGIPNVSGFSGILSVLAMLLFLIFLKKLATGIQDSQAVIRASNLINICIAFVILLITIFVFPPLSFVFLPLLLLGSITYYLLLSSLRKSLQTASVAPGVLTASLN